MARATALALCGALLCAPSGPARAEARQAEPLRVAAAAQASTRTDRAFSDALEKALSGKHDQAQALKSRLSDPVQRKVIDWLYAQSRSLDAGYARIIAFLDDNPDWPQQRLITIRAEQALYDQKAPAAAIFSFFASRQPETAMGKLALSRAYLARGDRAKAAAWAARAWREDDFSESGEKRVMAEFGGLIGQADHRARLVRLIYEQESRAALRTAARISSDHVKLAKAAAALFSLSKDGPRLYGAVPASLRNQLLLTYPLARYYRKTGNEAKARAMLRQVPASHNELSYPYPWWVERRLIARMSLRPGAQQAWREAYELASEHGYSSGEYFEQGEFLAGWIALRFLKQPEIARKHFSRLRKGTTKDREIARAEYWLGRVDAAVGRQPDARRHYEAAARRPFTYYGQLARDMIGLNRAAIRVSATPQASPADMAALDRNEVARAARMVGQAGQPALLPPFFSTLAPRLKSRGEATALATLAWRLGAPNLALRTAKRAASGGFDLGGFAYPVNALPNYERIADPVDRAFVLGLIRQESEFNLTATSGVGARGLMQIMPGTAKLIAKAHGQSYDASRLGRDAGYNLTLGTAHLSDLLKQYNGSYILTLVAYNAGPGRVTDWVERYGDPRTGEIEAVDWVEAIPFTETRGYVKKVMANVQVYRSRLDGPVRGLVADLHRGGPSRLTVTGAIGGSADGRGMADDDCIGGEAEDRIAALISCN